MMARSLGQRPSVLAAHGKPKSRLVRRTLPAFTAPKNAEEALKAERDPVSRPHGVAGVRDMARPAGTDLPDSSEASIDSVLTCIGSRNSLRAVLYKTLAFCEEEQEFSCVEAFISRTDEYRFSHLMQTPYALIHMLIDAGGLAVRGLDDQGRQLDEVGSGGLTPVDLQALADTFFVRTTDAGVAAIRLISPERRLDALLRQHPHRAETCFAFMRLCETPRTLAQIKEFYENTPGLAADVVQTHHRLSADFYIDKLDKAGVLVWRGAWTLNEAGRRLLAEHDGRRLEA